MLQARAGNRAVAGLVSPTVQRCGSIPAAQETAGREVSGKLMRIAAELHALHGFALGRAQGDGAESIAVAEAGRQGEDVVGVVPEGTTAQRVEALAARPRPVVQRQVAETLILVGGGMVGTAEAAAPVEAATGPPGWITGAVLLVAGAALIGIGVYMASQGNVADTGIMEEARVLVAAGQAADICAALAVLMAGTSDSRRKLRIKASADRPEPVVRAAAAESLGDLGAREQIHVVQAALSDPDEAVRAFAAATAGILGLDDEALARTLESEKSPWVRLELTGARYRLGNASIRDVLAFADGDLTGAIRLLNCLRDLAVRSVAPITRTDIDLVDTTVGGLSRLLPELHEHVEAIVESWQRKDPGVGGD